MERAARKRRRRGLGAFLVTCLVVLGLVVAFFLVDAGVRSYAEGRVKQEITASLPGTVTGDVAVSIGGTSVIAQYLSGSFDRVRLSAPALSVDGVAASVQVVATDVPLDRSKTVGDVRATVDLGQPALAALLRASLPAGAADTSLTLGAGTVRYAGTVTVFGIPIGYLATATPTAAADAILFTLSDARATAGGAGIDASTLVPLVLGQAPLRVCVARYLPAGVTLDRVNVTPERARITLQSGTLTLSRKSLTTLGACSAG